MQKIYQDLILHRKITKLTPNKKYKILNKNYLILLSNKKMNLLKKSSQFLSYKIQHKHLKK